MTNFTEFDPPLKSRCFCNRTGWNLCDPVVYERGKLGSIKDFNLTMEYLAPGGFWGCPRYVVTQRVRQMLRQQKAGVFFKPVHIVESDRGTNRKFEMPLEVQ